MTYYIQISTTDWPKDRVLFEDTLNTLEKLCDVQSGYILNEPVSKFGWIFIRLPQISDLNHRFPKMFIKFLPKYKKFQKY